MRCHPFSDEPREAAKQYTEETELDKYALCNRRCSQ